LEEIFAHARESFPNECCGWLTGNKDSYIANGVRRAVNAYDTKIHPTAKDRTPQTAFVISDKDLLALNQTLEDEIRPLIIYHSHPNGLARPSATDSALAANDGAIWAIIAVGRITLWRSGDAGFEALPYEVTPR